MDQKLGFEDFIAAVAAENQDFVRELHAGLTELGCKIEVKAARSGFVVSYMLNRKTICLLYTSVGTASCFSFNDPNGMCRTCSGLGTITRLDVESMIDRDKSWNQGCVKDSLFRPGSWYWKPVSYTHLDVYKRQILAGTVGEKLSAAAVSSLGAATFRFTINPLSTYLFSPLILVCSGLLALSLIHI